MILDQSVLVRGSLIEGKEREFELGMIFLFAARLGCLKESMSEEEFEEHFCDLERFVYNTNKRTKVKKKLIEKISNICNLNIDFQEASAS